MARFTVHPQRFDPYKNFKFQLKWDGRYVTGNLAAWRDVAGEKARDF